MFFLIFKYLEFLSILVFNLIYLAAPMFHYDS